MSEEIFKGEIVGCTEVSKHPSNREVTSFSVKSLEGKVDRWKIHGIHESLIPKRKIILKYNPNSTYPWAEGYTLFDEQEEPFYSFGMNFEKKFS